MTKNMEAVAQLLNIELNKSFCITGRAYCYMLTKNGLMYQVNNISTKVEDNTLDLLLQGVLTIWRDGYLPQKGELYYAPKLEGTTGITWENSPYDQILFENQMVCKTSEESDKLINIMRKAVKEFRDAN